MASAAPAAAALYMQGKVASARAALVRALDAPAAQDPARRLPILGALLDICIRSHAEDCLARYAPQYAATAQGAVAADPVQRQALARRAAYYADAARYALGALEDLGRILAGPSWAHENPDDAGLYIRRQLLAADILIARGKPAEADRALDKVTSLIASLRNPQEDRFTVASALSQVMADLVDIGQAERAYGIWRATGGFVEGALPRASLDAAVFHLNAARVLEAMGALEPAAAEIETAVAGLRRLELDAATHDALLANALTLQAAICAAQGQLDGARAALRAHPFAKLYAASGRIPQTDAEIAYLAARTFVAALGGETDPVAAQALKASSPSAADQVEVYRVAGAALGASDAEAARAGMSDAGRRIVQAARGRSAGAFGAWDRPSAIDQTLIGLVLAQTDRSNAADADEVAFALFQLAARRGPSFDADALTALSQARDELQRRAIHQGLRLRARRDRFERSQLQAATVRAAADPTGASLQHDPATRLLFRDFAARMERANLGLATAGIATSGANLVSLQRLQAALAPNEAALSVAAVPGGLAYMCVRRDTTLRRVAPVDLSRQRVDARLLQAALTASYPPSEMLDAQFPVGAAVRLYDGLIRPFEPCLRPGDHLIWLPGVASVRLPLSALLDHAPPRLAQGYDLAAADWLVRRYAVSYAGSASAVVAARTAARAASDFDFLGVGDPRLSGATAADEDRGRILPAAVRGGAELASLPPLPETRAELEASAHGYAAATLLTGEAATEHELRRQLVGSYRLLSFATHGLLRDDLQGLAEPALVLTPVSADDPTDDGLLTASEIADLNLSARFVALSACNTANFDLTQLSQDLPALASAFAVAGVPSTLATLWPVESGTSQQVVAATFAGLRSEEVGPAEALAAAQRAFLAAPPGRGYLHPRFWAPFVILGDGGAAAPAAARESRVASAEILTRGGGEVIALGRAGGRSLARFIGDADSTGRHAAGLRAQRAGRETWRREDPKTGAGRLLLELGSQVLAGGYGSGPDGRYGPILQSFDAASGQPLKSWQGDAGPGRDAFVSGGARLSPAKAVVLVAELDLRGQRRAGGARLRGLVVDAALLPTPLFETDPLSAGSIDEATVTPLGDSLLVTYSSRHAARGGTTLAEDDYDQPLCASVPVTRVELRDAKTGALKASQQIPGLVVVAAVAAEGRVLLGGSATAACADEARALVLAVTPDLQVRALYADASLGASEVRSLAPLAGGRTLLAASKETVVDYRPRAGVEKDPYAIKDLQTQAGGMVQILARDGAASPPKMLDAGANLLVTAVDAAAPDDLLVGGSLGGRAAILHLQAR